jgi:hypothetical protein
MNVDHILDKLERVRRIKPDQWVACCPAHEDSTPSLAIRDTGDKLLMRCYAGCTFQEIAESLGMRQHEFFRDGKEPKSGIPGVSRRDIYRDLTVELMTAYVVTRDRAEGKQIAPHDVEREKLAWQRISKAMGVLK